MIQKDLYLKDIAREIDGVIKANDDRHLRTELEEYVMTDELLGNSSGNRMLPGLFSELAQPNFNKCVWISGYFGSGKSHLLKMLSLVLSDTVLSDGTRAAKTFSEKGAADFELENDILRAAAIPTETILFNIQAKSDGIQSSNTRLDPVLAVFLKVFNEHQGYDPLSPEVANIERFLTQNGKLDYLKEQFPIRFGKSWEEARETFFMHQYYFEQLFAEIQGVSEEQAANYVNNAINNYNLDINAFANLVAAYLRERPKGSRLVFCVDEVGQYIAEDVTRMLSLQTIAELVSSKTEGRAFLIVTSQNDLDATVGTLNATQRHDFSRIQGRFALKIPLTSANADEVIQKRLLVKNEAANAYLAPVYEREQHNFRTLFRFEGDTVFNTGYKDVTHFENTFPFIPYQFDLLQQAIRELSKNNAFVGGHQSVGERSMLSIFQQVAKNYMHRSVGDIVPFAALYEGLTDILQSKITADIMQVSKSVSDPLAVELLKTLFLLKYVKGITTNVQNLTILLLAAFDCNLVEFRRKVQESLNLLEGLTYIRRTVGDVYEYLTNLEKDIEEEIKNTEIEPGQMQRLLNELLFTEIYSLPKIQLQGNRYLNYDYGTKCDGCLYGREKDFALHFITPVCMDEVMRANPLNASMANRSDLIVALTDDSSLRNALITFLQTDRYVKITHPQPGESIKTAILIDKKVQNEQRKQQLISSLRESVGQARLYLCGNELTEINQSNVKDRLNAGMTALIRLIYTNVGMLPGELSEDTIVHTLSKSEQALHTTDLTEAEQEVFNRICRNKTNHERTTLKALVDYFGGRPYGWYANAVNALVASLYKRGKVSLKRDGALLNEAGIIEALTKTNQYPVTLVEPEDEIQASQVNALKRFYQEYFGEPCAALDSREVSEAFASRLRQEVSMLDTLLVQKPDFPFLQALEAPRKRIKELSEKMHPYFYTELHQFEDQLLDDKEEHIELIARFMTGPQLDIYRQLRRELESNNANLEYVAGEWIEQLRSVRENAAPYRGNLIQQAKTALDALHREISATQDRERGKAIEQIGTLKQTISAFEEYGKLTLEQQRQVNGVFDRQIEAISRERFISNIRQKAIEAETYLYPQWLNRIAEWVKPVDPTPPLTPPSVGKESNIPKDNEPKHITYVSKNSVKVNYAKPALETEADVEEYIDRLRAEYLRIIHEAKKISL